MPLPVEHSDFRFTPQRWLRHGAKVVAKAVMILVIMVIVAFVINCGYTDETWYLSRSCAEHKTQRTLRVFGIPFYRRETPEESSCASLARLQASLRPGFRAVRPRPHDWERYGGFIRHGFNGCMGSENWN